MFKDGMAGMMKKAQQVQSNMKKAQAEIKKLNATGISGSGMVKITLTGARDATRVVIDERVLNDKDLLEDLILSAINDANQQITQSSILKMNDATNGMNLPF